jgi:hypothetical protein
MVQNEYPQISQMNADFEDMNREAVLDGMNTIDRMKAVF